MLADPEGREILRARPVINESTIDLAALSVSESLWCNTLSLWWWWEWLMWDRNFDAPHDFL